MPDLPIPQLSPATAKRVAYGTSLGRVAYGLTMVLIPELSLSVFGLRSIPGPLVWLARVFGVRDVVLGAGTLAAIGRKDGSAQQWLQFSAIADGADSVLALARPNELGRGRAYFAAAFAASAAVPGWLASRSPIFGSR